MTYTEKEKDALRVLVEMIVPASLEYEVPGAGDKNILADILSLAAPHKAAISAGLVALDALAQKAGGTDFTSLPERDRHAAAETFRSIQPEIAGLIAALTVQCYYRDDRVMRSLDMETRAPFPMGFEVDQGNWSLLAPVRARPKLYREI